VILYFSLAAPHYWAVVDRRDRVLGSGLAESPDQVPVRHRRITRRVGVVPGELVTIHSLRIPARNRTKAAAAAPYMLEESLASSVDELEFRLLRWVRGGESKVAVMSREAAAHWHEQLAAFPERTDALVPEYLLLPMHVQSRCTAAADGEDRLIIRTGELDGLVINEEELDLWWQESADNMLAVAVNDSELGRRLIEHGASNVSEWPIGRHFPEWLQHGHQVPQSANLLRHGTAAGDTLVPRPLMHAAAVLVGLAILIRLGADGYDYFTLKAREKALDREIHATLTRVFPDITRVVDPRAQMEQRLAELKGGVIGGGFLPLLSVVASALPRSNATVEEITFRDAQMLITCSTRDFQALEQLQQRFGQDDRVVVRLVSSGSRENSVRGRFQLGLRNG